VTSSKPATNGYALLPRSTNWPLRSDPTGPGSVHLAPSISTRNRAVTDRSTEIWALGTRRDVARDWCGTRSGDWSLRGVRPAARDLVGRSAVLGVDRRPCHVCRRYASSSLPSHSSIACPPSSPTFS